MSRQLRKERIHIMLTPRELEQLDAWAERNDFATRSEAVRYLVRIGIH